MCACVFRHMYYLFILMCIVQRRQILQSTCSFLEKVKLQRILVLLFIFFVRSPMKRNYCFEPCMGWIRYIFSAEFTIHFCCAGKNYRRKKSCVLPAVYTLLVSQMKRNYHSPFLIRTAAQEPNTEGVACRRIKNALVRWHSNDLSALWEEMTWLQNCSDQCLAISRSYLCQRIIPEKLGVSQRGKILCLPSCCTKKTSFQASFFPAPNCWRDVMRCL